MPTWKLMPEPDLDHGTMRCVVDERGSLVFASPAVGWSLGVETGALASKPASTIIDIISCHDNPRQPLGFDQLVSGFYEVALLRRSRDPLMLPARIDVISAGPDGRRYVVVWLDPDGKLKRHRSNDFSQSANEFAALVVDSQQKLQSIKPVPVRVVSTAPSTGTELRHFTDMTSDLTGVYLRDGTVVNVNPAFNKALGYSDEELQRFPFVDLIHPDDRGAVWSVMRKMLEAAPEREARVDFESRARCKDGTVRWIKWAQKALGDHVYIVGRDVTEIKQHEAALTRREEQLSEAQKIGRMGHWYWETGADTLTLSDQIYSIFGVEHGRFKPSVGNVANMVVKADFARIQKTFMRALVRHESYEVRFRLRHPEGGVRYIHCEGRCKVDPQTGKVDALYGIMQDITERTLHEQAMREAKEAAETAYASKTRFLANMSHELRTPLNAIIGFSEMIQRQLLGPVGNARYLDYIGGIRESGEHLLDMINDILDMSKIEIGKYELYVEDINLGKLIRLAVHMVEGRAQESSVHVITDNLPDDVEIVADRRAVMQVVLNLLSNAVKFTPEGGTVEIACTRVGNSAEITVRDTGVGIPKDKISVVTMPFEQVSSELTRNHEGSGLGLAITKDLVELHGGRLQIDSHVGQGTTVMVTLPQQVSCVEGVKMQTADVAYI